MRVPCQIKMSIMSRLEDVSLLGVALGGICRYARVPMEVSNLLECCLVEVVNNAIEHAYLNRRDGLVEVSVLCIPGEIRIQVCDTGIYMGKLTKPSLDCFPEEMETLPEGGMGLFIIHRVMDKVSYGSSGGRNTMKMIRRFRPVELMDQY